LAANSLTESVPQLAEGEMPLEDMTVLVEVNLGKEVRTAAVAYGWY
jgi:hypothetical protein